MKIDEQEAKQATTVPGMRYVLIIGTLGAIIVMGLLLLGYL